jgi:anti-anti-sigma factor
MSSDAKELQVYRTGELTVVGFGGQQILDQIDLSTCHKQLVELVEQSKCKTLAFDLTGVKLIPSGLLGLITSLRKKQVDVHLYNPSEDIQEVLDVTRLSDVLKVHHIDLTKDQAPA